jgi:hypothetical protein
VVAEGTEGEAPKKSATGRLHLEIALVPDRKNRERGGGEGGEERRGEEERGGTKTREHCISTLVFL